MRRDTACFSMYSLMSIRTMLSSLSNSDCASPLHSSVLPTPVGPRNMKLAIGRSGSERPARERWIASDTAATASRCPITRSCSTSSKESSLSRSLSSSLVTGMPVHLEMISEMSASVTSSRSMPPPSLPRSSSSTVLSWFWRDTSVPYLSSAARLRS